MTKTRSTPTPAVVHEAAMSATRHVGPTADRWSTALERYVQFMSRPDREPPGEPAPLRRDVAARTVKDVLHTSGPRAVRGTSFHDLARALQDAPSSAVPVVDDDDRVIGVVSTADLLSHVTRDAVPPKAGPGRHGHAERRRKQQAVTAGDLMTSPAITVPAHTTIAEAARVAGRHRVRSLPVVDEADRLLGMVSRADMVRLFLRDDDALRADIVRHVVRVHDEPGHRGVDVAVLEGVVTLSGSVRNAMTAARLGYRAGQVPGVVAVHNELVFAVDDSGLFSSGGPIFSR
ncbi:MAG: CBS domain-containing protein [Jatrophihabitans sp.]|uniref:CBS domain-containing protein n=1 Tax=Jatrophihabitans sp. TaxID=1932789 RepID=UPI003F820BDA